MRYDFSASRLTIILWMKYTRCAQGVRIVYASDPSLSSGDLVSLFEQSG